MNNKNLEHIINLCNKRENSNFDFEVLNNLINEKNIDGNLVDSNITPLSIAILSHNYKLIEFLLKKGANTNLYGKYGAGFAYLNGLIKTYLRGCNIYTTYLHYAIDIEMEEWTFHNEEYSGYCNVWGQ